MTIICRSCLFNREGHRNDNLIFLFQNLNLTDPKVDIFSMNKLASFNQHLFDDASLLRVGIDLLIAQKANNTEENNQTSANHPELGINFHAGSSLP